MSTESLYEDYTINSPIGPLKIRNRKNDISVSPELKKGQYEKCVQNMIAGIVEKDWTCLDIGANIGIHTLLMPKLAKVEAVEASPENIDCMLENFRINDIMSPKIYPAILGDGTRSSFHYLINNHACSYTSKFTPTNCKTVKLMDLINYQPDFIKIDIEGAELSTIESSLGVFRNTKAVCIELNKITSQSFYGYDISELYKLMFSLFRFCWTFTYKWIRVNECMLDTFFKKAQVTDVIFIN